MKAKFLSVLVILIGFTILPVLSATYYTDEQIEYLASDDGNYIHPSSIDPIFLKGTLSLNSKTITNTFFFDLGSVTFQILDENDRVVLTERTTAVAGGSYTISIEGWAAGKYKICCFIPNERTQVGNFQITD